MREFLSSTPAQAVIWVTVLVILCVVGYYVVQRVRRGSEQPTPTSHELLTGFRQMHQGGTLSPSEFRQIRSVLGSKVQQETGSDDTEETG
jgi:uncharacterized membrane protein